MDLLASLVLSLRDQLLLQQLILCQWQLKATTKFSFWQIHTYAQLSKCESYILHPLSLCAQEAHLQRRPKEVWHVFRLHCSNVRPTVGHCRKWSVHLLTDLLSSANIQYRVLRFGRVDSCIPHGVKCSAFGPSQDGTKAQFTFGSTKPRLVASVCVRLARRLDLSFLLCFSPSSWIRSNIPVMGFMSCLSLSVSFAPTSAPSSFCGISS